jgi:hypothetical protein
MTPEHIVELSGAQWVGVQETESGPMILFRDPVCKSCLALFAADLTLANIKAKMAGARVRFGLK